MNQLVLEQIVRNGWSPIVYANLEGIVEFTNQAADELYGYETGELIGQHVDIFNSHLTLNTDEIVNDITTKGGWSGELIQRKKDDTTFTALLTVWLVYDENGVPIGYFSNSRDLSRSLEERSALMQKEAELNAIIQNTDDMILSIDKDYNIIQFNEALRAIVAQRGVEMTTGMSVLEILDPRDHEKVLEIYPDVLAGNRRKITEEFFYPDGSPGYVESFYNPIVSGDEITGISIFASNITERMLKEQKLKDTLNEKEILLQEIHHRLKNNLAVISGMLNLQVVNTDSEEVKRALNDSQSRIKSTAMVHEMLYENESLSDINFANYANRLLVTIKDSFNQKKDAVTVTVEGDPVSLDLEYAIPCGLILNELVTNAYKHAFKVGENGEINVTFKKENGHYVLTVADSGQGFENGQSIENSNSTGFTIVNSLVNQLSGTLSFESDNGLSCSVKFAVKEDE